MLRKIDFYEGRSGNIVGYALRLLALLFPRPGVPASWQVGNGLTLTSTTPAGRTISENTLNVPLKAMGYEAQHCAHGFRSSASTLPNKERVDGRRRFERELIEVQLDHVDESTRAIYDRDNLWQERVALMQFWADKIDQWKATNVVAIKAA